MGVSPGQNPAPGVGPGVGHQQHGPDAQAGALGGVDRGAAEKSRGVLLALGDNAGGVEQIIRPVDLRQIPVLAAKFFDALVPRHVEPCRGILGVLTHKVTDGGIH